MAKKDGVSRALMHFYKVRPTPKSGEMTSAPKKVGAIKRIPAFRINQNTYLFAPAGLWPFEIGRSQFQRSCIEFGFRKLFPTGTKTEDQSDLVKKASLQYEYVRLVNMLAQNILMAHRRIAETNRGFQLNGHWIEAGFIQKKGNEPAEWIPLFKDSDEETESCIVGIQGL